jgi:hypothetical protein
MLAATSLLWLRSAASANRKVSSGARNYTQPEGVGAMTLILNQIGELLDRHRKFALDAEGHYLRQIASDFDRLKREFEDS